MALHLLEIRASCKRRRPRCAEAIGFRSLDDNCVGQRSSAIIEAERGVDGRHVVVVGEVGVELTAEREGCIILVECAISGSTLVNWRVGQASNELVCEADTLSRAKWVAVAIAIVPEDVISAVCGSNDRQAYLCRVS